MTLHFDVWSDFVCPWCYIGSTVLEKLEDSHGITVNWHAFELRPKNAPPITPDYRERINSMKPRMIAIAKENYGITINQGKFGIDSRPALVGMAYAKTQGKGNAYHKIVFQAYWEEAQNIEDLNTLANLADKSGLDREAFLAALNDPDYNNLVDADVERAHSYQIHSVPSAIIEEKFMLSGAQPYDEMVRIINQLQERIAQNA